MSCASQLVIRQKETLQIVFVCHTNLLNMLHKVARWVRMQTDRQRAGWTKGESQFRKDRQEAGWSEKQRQTDLTDVTAPCRLLMKRWGDKGDGDRGTTLCVHDQTEIQPIVVHFALTIAARCVRQQVSCRVLAVEAQVGIHRGGCGNAASTITMSRWNSKRQFNQ